MPVAVTPVKSVPKSSTSTSSPTPIADVTGSKGSKLGRPKGVPNGPRTKPSLVLMAESNLDMLGAIVNTARSISAANDGYVNKDMIYRKLKDHPAFQRMIEGPADSPIEAMRAYDLLTPEKIHATHQEVVARWQAQFPNGDPYSAEYDADTYGELNEAGINTEYVGGPKKGPFAKLVRARQIVDVGDL